MKRYEAMFLFDNSTVHEWSEIEAEVRRLFDRIEAQPLVILKYDERKLAYEIKGRKRGTYVLSYFDANPLRIGDLERDVRLSDLILRALVLRIDKLSAEKLAELQARRPDQPLSPFTSEGRRGDGHAKTARESEEDLPESEGPLEDDGADIEAATLEKSRESR